MTLRYFAMEVDQELRPSDAIYHLMNRYFFGLLYKCQWFGILLPAVDFRRFFGGYLLSYLQVICSVICQVIHEVKSLIFLLLRSPSIIVVRRMQHTRFFHVSFMFLSYSFYVRLKWPIRRSARTTCVQANCSQKSIRDLIGRIMRDRQILSIFLNSII